MDEYDDGPYWVILLMYRSHDMRHTGFPQVDDSQWDPRVLGCHNKNENLVQAAKISSMHFSGQFSGHRLGSFLKILIL